MTEIIDFVGEQSSPTAQANLAYKVNKLLNMLNTNHRNIFNSGLADEGDWYWIVDKLDSIITEWKIKH